MLQRLGRARSAKGDPIGPAGLSGNDGAGAPAGAEALADLSEVNGTSLADEPGRPGWADPSGEGGRPRQGGRPGVGGRPGAAGRPRDTAGNPRDTGTVKEAAGAPAPAPAARATRTVELPPDFDLAAHDPLRAFLLSQAGAVDITRLELASPALATLKAAGIVLVVPLVSSGELIGLLNLGPRLSERGYSGDDRRLLGALAGYAAPAMRVGQLVRQQQAEARDRERIEQELKVAQLIQQQFLPKSVPDLPSWHVAAFYRPARTVGGDFYDFIPLPDGRLMVVIGDVTDKGVPAALVMASTHALLRGAAPRLISPGEVLAHVNELLCQDIPAHMFVTCLALVLHPATGLLEFANAGHDVPYVRTEGGVAELRARGMPLGLMPGMEYEEKTFQMRPGDSVLLHSDGLAEAHSSGREMFGFPRVSALVGRSAAGAALIDACLAELAAFTGPGHEQEDDITLVTLERSRGAVYAEGTS
jgi:serine phosphatase RsbU (regulator of sigma subunit)